MEKCRPRSSLSDEHYEFLKVYFSQLNFNDLKIPRDFLKNFKGGQPKKVALKNVTGQRWVVDLELNDGGLFFKKRWSKFIKDNSVEDGEFLIFRYNEQSGLNVRIFGHNGCMKEESVKINAKNETEDDDQLAHNQKNSGQGGIKPEGSRNNVACGSKPSTSKSPQLTSATDEEKERALESAKTFTSENPFFIASMTKNFKKCNVTNM